MKIVLTEMANLPDSSKAAANHLIDFDPPTILHPLRLEPREE